MTSKNRGNIEKVYSLDAAKRVAVVAALVEGNSLRATARMTGVARMTIEKLLRDLGVACEAYHNEHVRNLKTRRVECDEIWSFVGSKQKNVPDERKGQWGDIWTWTAIAESKLMVSFRVGQRTASDAYDFTQDVASRLANRVQHEGDDDHWRPEAPPRLDQLRGTPEPHNADAHAPVHSADEWLLQEGRNARARCGAALQWTMCVKRPHPATESFTRYSTNAARIVAVQRSSLS